MMEIIGNVLQIIALLSIVFIITKGNRDFFKLIDDFNSKLPPVQKKAKEGVDSRYGFTVMDTTNMSLNLSTDQIDSFQKKLELFKYNKILFRKKKIISYSNNIQRLLKTSDWEKFGVATVQNLLENDSFKNSKPYLFGCKIGEIIGF